MSLTTHWFCGNIKFKLVILISIIRQTKKPQEVPVCGFAFYFSTSLIIECTIKPAKIEINIDSN